MKINLPEEFKDSVRSAGLSREQVRGLEMGLYLSLQKLGGQHTPHGNVAEGSLLDEYLGYYEAQVTPAL